MFWFPGADCHRFQFECDNKDEPSLSECVAVYDRCNGIAQCHDASDEMDCPTDNVGADDSGMQVDEPVSSLTVDNVQPNNAGAKNPQYGMVFPGTGKTSNESQSRGIAAALDIGHSSMKSDDGSHFQASSEMKDAEDHLEQLSDSVAGRRVVPSAVASDMATNTYDQKVAQYGLKHNIVPNAGKSVEQLTERQQGRPVVADRKAAPAGNSEANRQRPVASDDTVSQRGHLLLSSMVDSSDKPKNSDPAQQRYSAVKSVGKTDTEDRHTDSHGGRTDGRDYHEVPHKPVFGSVDVPSPPLPADHVHRTSNTQYGSVEETHRLRKPDLGHVNSGLADTLWQPSDKSETYRYGLSSPGQYHDYLKSNGRSHGLDSGSPSSGQMPSSSLANQNSQYVKNRDQVVSDSSAGGTGRLGQLRGGLTEARLRKPADEKDRDRGPGTRGFPSNHPVSSQYEDSRFRSRGFSGGDRHIKSPDSRHSALVADQSPYPANSRDDLYGDSFYPSSEDYYYAGGPAVHAPGYDLQAPVDYDYYNMAPGQFFVGIGSPLLASFFYMYCIRLNGCTISQPRFLTKYCKSHQNLGSLLF